MSTETAVGNDVLLRLALLDACAVSDAMDALGIAGVPDGLTCLTGPTRISGRIVTTELGPKSDTPSTRHLGTTAIESASAGDIIVMAHKGRVDAAGWGGILSRAAKYAGVGGVIVDGACRDVDEAREIAFPVFGKSGTPRTARGRVEEKSCNEPIVVQGITVNPGDLVLADSSGVVFIPASQAKEVIAKAEMIVARERRMTQYVLSGIAVSKVMGSDYEQMLETSSEQAGS